MTGVRVWEQFKKACSRSVRSSTPPRSSGSGSTSPSSCPPRRCEPKDKPIYVAADPADQTCILVGPQVPGARSCDAVGGGGGGSAPGAISLCFSSNISELRVSEPNHSETNGGQSSGSKDPNCIEIKGSGIVKTGGLQIMPCEAKAGGGGESGGEQISVAPPEGGACGGGVQLGSGKKAGQPPITCEPGSQDLEITYRPEKRHLNMNHMKPTVASMIAKRMTELEIERKLTAGKANEGIHERRC